MKFLSNLLEEKGWDKIHTNARLFYIAIIFVIIGGINTLGLAFDINLLENILGKGIFIFVIYILIGISTISIMFYRNTYLPFLGPTVAPCGAFENRTPSNATREVSVKVAPHKKVLYWAAEPANENLKHIPTWKEAYDKYENAGVTTSNNSGIAILRVREPQPYSVPFRKLLDSHIHYRVCDESGWLGQVNTIPIRISEGIEPFEEKDEYAEMM